LPRMGFSDKAVGAGMLLVACVVFVYYTIWAIFLPFLPASHPLQSKFPPREWAVRGPAFLLVAGISAIGLFIGVVMYREGKKKKARLTSKTA